MRLTTAIRTITIATLTSSTVKAFTFVPRTRILSPHCASAVRLYSSSNSNNNNNNNNVFEKLKDTAKGFLPRNWGKSKGEIERRDKVRNEVSGGISELFKDAPLPVRLMGSMIAPIVSTMASGLAESMKAQAREMEDLLDDARRYIVRDEAASRLLGDTIDVQAPFSQSSSSMSVNGKMSSRVQASFPVSGSRGSGVATMMATEEGIQSLSLKVGMRTVDVSLTSVGGGSGGWSSGTSSSPGLGKNTVNKGNVIDVEFTEKK